MLDSQYPQKHLFENETYLQLNITEIFIQISAS